MAPAELSPQERAGERAASNTLIRAAGEVFGKLASLFLFAAVGRTLGEDGLGIFVFALSFGVIALIPIDLGFDRALLREVAADRRRAGPMTANVLAFKLALTAPTVALAVLAVSFFDQTAEARTVVYVLLLGLVLESLGRTVAHLFMAFERSGALTLGIIVQRLLAAALGVFALVNGLTIVSVAWAYTIGAAAGLLVSCALLIRRVPLQGFRVTRAASHELASTATFAVQDIATLLLFRVDAVILSVMASTAAVGRYGAAYRIFESTWFVTVALFGAFVAMFTYLGDTTDPPLKAVFERALKVSLVALLPCSLAFGLSAPALIELVFGPDLAGAVPSLQILAPAVVLLGVGAMSTTFLMSRRCERPVLVVSFVAVGVNVGLNVALIPGFGAAGSAVAMLGTELVLAGVGLYYCDRLLGGLRWRTIAAGALVAGAAMAAVIVAVGGGIVAMLLGAAAYVAVLWLVERAVNPDEARYVVAMVRRRLPGLSPG